MKPKRERIYGLLAEFDNEHAVLRAARLANDAGYRRTDAFSPFPVQGLAAALGRRRTRVPAIVLTGGIIGGAGGYFLQLWLNAWNYPINVGGRPLNSWPAFVPITFELTILCAAIAAVLGMLVLNGLPQPYHPLFHVPVFRERASRDRFFLCIEARDAKFELNATRQFLESLSPRAVLEVPR
jgi:hypothetical protein